MFSINRGNYLNELSEREMLKTTVLYGVRGVHNILQTVTEWHWTCLARQVSAVTMSVDGSVRYQVTKSVSLQSSPFYMADLVLFAVTWA